MSVPEAGTAEVAPGPRTPCNIAATVRAEGVARLRLRIGRTALVAESNLIRVARAAGPACTGVSSTATCYDGSEINVLNEGTHPDSMYAYGRDVTRLDFVAMGSHISAGAPMPSTSGGVTARRPPATTRRAATSPLWAASGATGSDAGGDRNLVWRDLDAPRPDPTWRIEDLYRILPGQGAVVIPHVGGAIAFPCCHDPRAESLCEMASGHGNFEWFAQAYLQKGYRLGLIGGSDGHKGTPGHPRVVGTEGGRFFNLLRRRDGGWLGGPLLGVYAERLDRHALWEAFRQRHTYASTGARTLLEFRANDALMGRRSRARTRLSVRVEGNHRAGGPRRPAPAPLAPRSLAFEATLAERPPRGETYHYVRSSRRTARSWSSPIWVRAEAGRRRRRPARLERRGGPTRLRGRQRRRSTPGAPGVPAREENPPP